MDLPGRPRCRSVSCCSRWRFGRPASSVDRAAAVHSRTFILVTIAVAAAVFAIAQLVSNNYLFFAGYTVLQFVVLATAWNILGGYCGYVNFGSAAFFAAGAYSSVALHKLGANIDRYFPESLAGIVKLVMPFNI